MDQVASPTSTIGLALQTMRLPALLRSQFWPTRPSCGLANARVAIPSLLHSNHLNVCLLRQPSRKVGGVGCDLAAGRVVEMCAGTQCRAVIEGAISAVSSLRQRRADNETKVFKMHFLIEGLPFVPPAFA